MTKYTIFKTNRFIKDYAKMRKRNNFDEKEFVNVITMLANGVDLPAKYCNHILEPKSKRFILMSHKTRLATYICQER